MRLQVEKVSGCERGVPRGSGRGALGSRDLLLQSEEGERSGRLSGRGQGTEKALCFPDLPQCLSHPTGGRGEEVTGRCQS